MKNKKTFAAKLVSMVLAVCMAFGVCTVAVSAADAGMLGSVDPAVAVGEYVIPDGTTAIGDYAFQNCTELTAVVIPASVKSIGMGAFAGCTALASVTFGGKLDSVGVQAFTDTAWYRNYPTDFVYASSPSGFNLLIGYKGENKEVEIPISTSMIASGAFYQNKTITSVAIPLRTTQIGDYAFYGCENLSSVSVKGALNDVGYQAFEGTAWLKNYAGDFVIFGTMLLKYNGNDDMVLIPNTVTRIASYAFEGCTGVTSVRVPSSVKNIGVGAFYLFNDGGNNKYAEIYCWEDTYAAEYAARNGLQVAAYLRLPGDVDGNGSVQSIDARVVLRYAAKLDRSIDDPSFLAADVGGDGKLDSADARLILRMSARLAEYTPEELLYKPNTDFEILMAYTEAVRLAYIKEAGYKLTEFQSIDDVNVGPSWIRTVLRNPFKTELTKEKKAKAQTLSSDTVEALEKLYLCDLTNNNIIKSAKCVLSVSDKYYITIVLADELDVADSESLTSCIFPVVAREDIDKLLEEKEGVWYHARNTDFNYNITYTGCTLNAIVDVKTGNIEDLEMKMGYRFDIWGQIMLTKINNPSNKNTNVGTVTRTDTVKYKEFDYTVKEFTTTTTEAPATLAPGQEGNEDPNNPVTVVPTTTAASGNFLDSIGDALGNIFGGLLG